MPDFEFETADPIHLINDATDILNELRDRQYLLECVAETIDHAWHHGDRQSREWLVKISTVLSAYDNEKVTTQLSKAIHLLSESRDNEILFP